MHSITLNQNWKKVRVTLDPPQKGPSRKGKKPILFGEGRESGFEAGFNNLAINENNPIFREEI